jgi:hypothetical protein
MKINPYKIGMNFYIILITFVFTFLGCKTFEKYDEQQKMKRIAESIWNTPDLTRNKKQ